MSIRVNWNQGKASGLIRAHQVLNEQPKNCRFGAMKNDCRDFSDVVSAETAMKEKGYTRYKHCEHCWDGDIVSI